MTSNLVHNCIGVANHHPGGLLVNTQCQSCIHATHLISKHRQSLLPSAFQETHWTKTLPLHKSSRVSSLVGEVVMYRSIRYTYSKAQMWRSYLCCNAAKHLVILIVVLVVAMVVIVVAVLVAVVVVSKLIDNIIL